MQRAQRPSTPGTATDYRPGTLPGRPGGSQLRGRGSTCTLRWSAARGRAGARPVRPGRAGAPRRARCHHPRSRHQDRNRIATREHRTAAPRRRHSRGSPSDLSRRITTDLSCAVAPRACPLWLGSAAVVARRDLPGPAAHRTVHRFPVLAHLPGPPRVRQLTTVRLVPGRELDSGAHPVENDNPIWPHCDGLNWPHPRVTPGAVGCAA